jgi:hypothetical protein
MRAAPALLVGLVTLAAAVSAQQPAAPPAAAEAVHVPPTDAGIDTLEARRQAQEATLGRFEVPIDLRFTDRAPESGITFVHDAVDDAGKTYKAAHYDHGNGIAAADVDGDGRIDLYFPNQLGGSELWLNNGDGTFRNGTAAAGVGLPGRITVSAAFGDVDNDGDQDLFVTSVRGGNALFVNDGKGAFRDATTEAGLAYVGHSSGAVFLDYDRDGRLDLFVVNVGKYTTEVQGRGGYWIAHEDAFASHLKPERTETDVLYRNLGGGRFADVTKEAGLGDGAWSGDATATDLNRDGWPDLYLVNMQGDDHYYENRQGTFVDRTAETFPQTSWGAMGVKSFDYDNDGDLDLYVTDMHSDMFQEAAPRDEKIRYRYTGERAEAFFSDGSNNIFGNSFWVNEGGGKFREAAETLGVEVFWPWGLSVDDVNADGFQDIFVTASMNYPFRYGLNSLLINNRGNGFLDAELITGIEPRRDGRHRKDWFALDCSGEDRAHRLCAGRQGRVTVTGSLGSRSSVIFDLEGDGDLDIVTNELHDRPMVLVSDLAQRRPVSWLAVRLQGTRSNRNGLGAEVAVTAGGRTQTRLLDGASGYLSHSVLPLYFGLERATAVDRIEVRWPNGERQVVQGPIAAGRTLDVVEAAAAPAAGG